MMTNINILFDCDGTLVDSEHLYVHLLSDILCEMGYNNYTVEHCYATFCGTNHKHIHKYLVSNHPGFDFEHFEGTFLKCAAKKAVTELKAIDGAGYILEALKDHPRCLVTNGFHDIVKFSLEVTDLQKYFHDDQMFTIDMVSQGKPKPDLYNLAMSRMGFQKENCIAIEDSVVGATAAVAAGIHTIGFVNEEKQHISYYIELEEKLRAIGVHEIIYKLEDCLKIINTK